MKRKLNLIVLLVVLLVSTTIMFAQKTSEVEFTYDNSGNRTIRQIVNLKIAEETTHDTIKPKSTYQTNYAEVIADQKVSIFPNPTAGMFKVVIDNYQENQNISIYLHTVSGILIHEIKETTAVSQIDIRNRENGAYILTVIIAGKRKTWKIIKN